VLPALRVEQLRDVAGVALARDDERARAELASARERRLGRVDAQVPVREAERREVVVRVTLSSAIEIGVWASIRIRLGVL
jgi:hypothetical protein